MMQDYTYSNDALLAGAFARSQKMMRFIDAKYDHDKEKFYQAAKKNSRFKSRFITGNRLPIRMNAIKALGVIEAAKADEQLSKEMLEAAGRAFKQVYNSFDFQKKGECKVASFEETLACMAVKENASDNNLHDAVALYFYFCENFNLAADTENPYYNQIIPVVKGKEFAYLKSFADIGKDFVKEHDEEHEAKRYLKDAVEFFGHARNIAEMGANLPDYEAEHDLYQMMWDFAQLDNIPATMYENEEFSIFEIQDIFNTIKINSYKGSFNQNDFYKYYIIGLFMRSFARIYHEAEAVVDKYAGIVRESDQIKDFARELSAVKSRSEELEKLNGEKQQSLNDLQLELDRTKKKVQQQENDMAIMAEQIKILQQLLDEGAASGANAAEAMDDATRQEILARAKEKKAVVFGGHPNWQVEVRNAAPGFTIIEPDNYGFDAKIIDKADVIVIKTDYMAHAQWYKVIERAKKKGKKIIFCTNSVEDMLVKICNEHVGN